MLTYNDLYELLRKEKYSETLQQLPKNFLNEISMYLQDKRQQSTAEGDFFQESVAKSKKQLENSISIFKELILRRKRKLLNLVFVAAETGIMKRDYEMMLSFERDIFEKLVKAFEEGDKELSSILHGRKDIDLPKYKMILFQQDVEQFVDLSGNVIGPYPSGSLVNIDAEVADILVTGGKATFVDEG